VPGGRGKTGKAVGVQTLRKCSIKFGVRLRERGKQKDPEIIHKGNQGKGQRGRGG